MHQSRYQWIGLHATWKVRREGRSRDVDAASGVCRNAAAIVNSTPTKIGREPQRRAGAAKFGHKRIGVSCRARLRRICEGEIGRVGEACHIGILEDIDRYAAAEIETVPTQVGGI